MSKRRHEGDSAPAKVQRGSEDAVYDANNNVVSRKSVLKAHIIGLNSQFASWISSQNAARSDALWIEGVKDYLKFAEGLVEEFNDVIPLGTKTAGKAAPAFDPPKAFGFGSVATSRDAAPQATSTTFGAAAGSSAGFSFGAKPAEDKSTTEPQTTFGADKAPVFGFGSSSGFNFSSDATKAAPAEPAAAASGAPAFTFGGPPASTAAGSDASPTLFAFGKPAGTSSAPLFSFAAASAAGSGPGTSNGAAAPVFSFGGSAATAAPSNGGEDAEGEEEGPAKFESEVTVNEESGSIVFKAKSKFCHLAKPADGGKASWESKGVGTFMLRTRNDESKKPFVTFTTEAGRVLYIANIPKTMQVMLLEAKNAVTFSAPWAPDGTSTPTMQGVMFAFPKGMNTAFKAEVEKCQASMA